MRLISTCAVGAVVLAGCLPESELEGSRPVASEREACVAQGGTYTQAGLSQSYLCITPTPDADKTCSAESDCTGLCLAETRSCSSVTPMFGCHPILLDDGTQAEICID